MGPDLTPKPRKLPKRNEEEDLFNEALMSNFNLSGGSDEHAGFKVSSYTPFMHLDASETGSITTVSDGNWSSSTAYVVGDAVTANSKNYTCLSAHTSALDFTDDLDAGNWRLGGHVSQWDDLSGNGNHVTQGTGSAQPGTGNLTTHGRNVIDFDGDEYLATSAFSSALSQPNTIFVVGKMNVITGNPYFYDGIADGFRHAVLVTGTPFAHWMYSGAGSCDGGIADTDYRSYSCVFNTPDSEFYKSGTLLAAESSGQNDLTGITLGSRFNFSNKLHGTIAEFILFDYLLTTQQRQKVEIHLQQKWSII